MKIGNEPIYRQLATPYSALPVVTLLQETWGNKISLYRPHIAKNENWVDQLFNKPDAIVVGTTDPHNVAFVCTASGLLSEHGSPLVGFVNPTTTIIDSIGHRRDFKNINGLTVLWKP